eukprot:12416969-Karenia_brevis.AAC.1
MICCKRLVFFCQQELAKGWNTLVHVSDSSDGGFALMCKKATVAQVKDTCRWAERWRFLDVDLDEFTKAGVTSEWNEIAWSFLPLSTQRSDNVFADGAVRGRAARSGLLDTELSRWA